MNLYEKTKELWFDDHLHLAERSLKWAKVIEATIPQLEDAGRQLNEPNALRLYAAIGTAAKTGSRQGAPIVRFSLRSRGQEVAEVVVVGAAPTLLVTEKHQEANRKYFKCQTNKGQFPWDSPVATAFRRAFRALETMPRIPEHSLESRFLIEMEKKAKTDKFAGTLFGVRHAGLSTYEYPFQCPVPVSANKGEPVATTGHIDIVTRHRVPRKGVRLSIWELKKPHTTANAVRQAYIYAVAMVLMLRSEGGDVWFHNFGFGTTVPKHLNIEAVIAVTKDQRGTVEREVTKLLAESNPLELHTERATISLHAAFYDTDTLAIEWLDL